MGDAVSETLFRESRMLSDSPALPRRTIPIILGIVLATFGTASAQIKTHPASRVLFAQDVQVKDKDVPALPKHNIGECIKIGMEKQPKLAALRASVGSATASQTGLERANLIIRLTMDYKFRKQQAANGVLAAQADYEQSIHDITYAIAWTYYSVVYAREQVKVAKEAVEFVDFYREQVQKIVEGKEGGNKEINQITLNRLIARLADGKRLLIKARAGQERAMAALREAMGVDHEYAFEVADPILPDFAKLDIEKKEVISNALNRRGEVIMAALASEVTQLEAYAQWSIKFRFRVETFAAGGDIHSRPIPSGNNEGEYRPAAVGPEMPTLMVGDKHARSAKSWELVARSQAVLEKTRNLVTLEAANAWIEYFFAGQSMAESKIQSDAGKKNLELLKKVAGDQVSSAATLQQLLEAQEEAAKGQATYNEAVYQRISALANIERITGGGVKINYPGR